MQNPVYDHHQSILPSMDVFAPQGWVTPPGTPIQAAAGAGAMGKVARAAMSPAGAALRGLGLDVPGTAGATGASKTIPAVVTLVILGAAGYLSFRVGKALAPRSSSETMWGVIAIPAGILTGPIGLGIMAMVAGSKGR